MYKFLLINPHGDIFVLHSTYILKGIDSSHKFIFHKFCCAHLYVHGESQRKWNPTIAIWSYNYSQFVQYKLTWSTFLCAVLLILISKLGQNLQHCFSGLWGITGLEEGGWWNGILRSFVTERTYERLITDAFKKITDCSAADLFALALPKMIWFISCPKHYRLKTYRL